VGWVFLAMHPILAGEVLREMARNRDAEGQKKVVGLAGLKGKECLETSSR
jgi:hypothetical protein